MKIVLVPPTPPSLPRPTVYCTTVAFPRCSPDWLTVLSFLDSALSPTCMYINALQRSAPGSSPPRSCRMSSLFCCFSCPVYVSILCFPYTPGWFSFVTWPLILTLHVVNETSSANAQTAIASGRSFALVLCRYPFTARELDCLAELCGFFSFEFYSLFSKLCCCVHLLYKHVFLL